MIGGLLGGMLGGLRDLWVIYRGGVPGGDDLWGEKIPVAVVLGTEVLVGGRPSRTLEARVRHAARMYAGGKIDRLVVTGGLGKHPPAEAEVMARILREEGVPGEAVLIEDKAKSTWDSARFLADVLAEKGVREVLVVTDPLHCVRTAAAFERVGIIARPEPVYSSPMWRDPWSRRGQYFRESGALVWYGMRYGVGGALPAVAVGVLAVSSAAVMIRVAGAPALAIAFWRCALGVLILLPPALVRRDRFPTGRTLYVGIASGVALGAHFGFWISSLDYTSVAASVVLVSNTPVFVAILAYLLFGEKTTVVSFAGILVALGGTILIAQDDKVGSAALFGNALAILGALTFTVYVLVGRSQRSAAEPVGVLPYSIVLYSAAALALLPVALLAGDRLWGYSWETWFWLAAITVGPQILGHTVFNWALRYVEASVISGTVLAEPVVAAVLAWLVLSEKPGPVTVIGGAIVLVGIFLLLRGRRAPPGP